MVCITYSIKDVSVILGVSVSTVYNLISDGVIPYVRVGGRYMIPINEFQNWFNSNIQGGLTNE